SAARYRWTNHLRPDGEAHTFEELFGESFEKCGIRIDRDLGWPPAIYTDLGSFRMAQKRHWWPNSPINRNLLWPAFRETLLSIASFQGGGRNDQGFGPD